jgi:hypothetical protein
MTEQKKESRGLNKFNYLLFVAPGKSFQFEYFPGKNFLYCTQNMLLITAQHFKRKKVIEI